MVYLPAETPLAFSSSVCATKCRGKYMSMAWTPTLAGRADEPTAGATGAATDGVEEEAAEVDMVRVAEAAAAAGVAGAKEWAT